MKENQQVNSLAEKIKLNNENFGDGIIYLLYVKLII